MHFTKVCYYALATAPDRDIHSIGDGTNHPFLTIPLDFTHVVVAAATDLGIIPCNEVQSVLGATTTVEHQVYSGVFQATGTFFNISFDMYDNPDRLEIFDAEFSSVYDSGYVGTAYPCLGTHPTLASSGGGCQGMAGPARSGACPTKNNITIQVPSPQTYSFQVTARHLS